MSHRPEDAGTAKITELFLGVPAHPDDPPEPVLRVSWYLREDVFEAEEGSVTVPGHHVRFSIWPFDRPVCAMSVPESEATRLGSFLVATGEGRDYDSSSAGSSFNDTEFMQ